MRQQILDLRNENLRATGSSEENKVGYGQHIKVPNSHLTSGAIVSGKVYLRTGLIDLTDRARRIHGCAGEVGTYQESRRRACHHVGMALVLAISSGCGGAGRRTLDVHFDISEWA
ncbi:hypothetical protein QSH46_015465 [Xanthomonas arboricola pv. juglandis]|uniref:Uncharacterized protein n=1 Tax=Xanthomonas campestris pv. juglandis TaxID=195709 RepID=A0A8E4ET46_XANCJ|nr:hypothetical protein [Xanthomonas arboricola]MDN0204207.1 hypothetical protein [Xanthomonas arboricola pv. corylina]MDN0217321.1 hypothetical protein [Xanthomonas arboricola pv. corylina]MDN0221377.1 hypothetical protein [Xanthomonas arboricola pv. juglandis]MDN0225651.1 hypothetical protein [Xanthomonas arboricola pv. juglandis]MDN0229955.1 hypothetical protein [Xanthomonas arboricola pv. juglandis]